MLRSEVLLLNQEVSDAEVAECVGDADDRNADRIDADIGGRQKARDKNVAEDYVLPELDEEKVPSEPPPDAGAQINPMRPVLAAQR